ncbi:MAG: thiamine phosphate synthase [Clostridiales bacterium]|nr:thiamine phosphate synthase [Clostridiales bacterium]
MKHIDYTLYLCTDRGLMTTRTVEESVEQAILGGATVIQLREKDLSSRDFYNTARKVREVTARHHIPFLINDRADIALAVQADGVHVGQSDLPCAAVRRMMGKDAVIGVSVSTVEEALAAQADGADYLGVGAMFATGTKQDAEVVGREVLCAIRAAVSIPIVIIGGINAATIPQFAGLGIDGAAVVSAIVAQPDVRAAAQSLRTICDQTFSR